MKTSTFKGMLLLFLVIMFTASCSGDTSSDDKNSNANLSYLSISSGTLSPVFDPEEYTYTVDVTSDVTQLQLTPTVQVASSKILVGGNSVTSGSVSTPIILNVGQNIISVRVEAESGLINTYIIKVTRPSPINQVATPAFSQPTGTSFKSSLVIALTCATEGATIYYTTDGSTPTSLSTAYDSTNMITLTKKTTLKAIAVKSGMNNSDVSTAEYIQSDLQQVETPAFSPATGNTFTGTLDVTITCATSGASIYYTTNGNEPTTSSALYSGKITLSDTTTIKAIAVKADMTDSAVATATYTKIKLTAEKPTFNPASGTNFAVGATLSVTISSATAGATICYTIDGSTPTATSNPTATPATITLSAAATVNAIAIKADMTNSDMASAKYTQGDIDDKTLTTTYYKTNPNSQYGKYKTGMSVTCTSMKSDGFTDWSSDMIIAQGVANDVCQSFRGSHEAPLYDTYALYAAWDDTNLYLGWQYVNVVDVVDSAQGYPISDNGKPWNGDIRITLAFDINSTKDLTGCLSDGVTGVWDDPNGTVKWYNKFDNGLDLLMNMSSKPGVGTPGVFYPNATNTFDYTAANCKKFADLGIVYGYIDGLLPANVYGINKPGAWAGYLPADLLVDSNFVDMLTLGHSKTQDTFYEMKIPFAALGITRSQLESTGIGVMLVSTFGCSGIGSIPYDPTVYDVVNEPYMGSETSTSKEKCDVDTFTYNMARIGHK